MGSIRSLLSYHHLTARKKGQQPSYRSIDQETVLDAEDNGGRWKFEIGFPWKKDVRIEFIRTRRDVTRRA